jgi:chaperone modulatory protein CbpM
VQPEHIESLWLTDDNEFTCAELAELAGISEAELNELVDYGAVTPINPDALPWSFNGTCLLTIRTACRLRLSFDLDPHGVALTVSLLERIHGLEAQITRLRAQFPQHRR